jgi:nucleoside-diphosphate-sugar epimerase
LDKEIQRKMKILVTGSRGFIGQHLVPALEESGHDVCCADRQDGIDLCDKAQVDNLPDVDIVVHLAAHNGTKHFYNRPFDVVRDGVLPTQYLLERYAGKVKRFVFTGTCESYAGAVDLFNYPVPTNEKVPLVIGDVTNPRWSYGGSKIVNEIQVVAAKEQFGQRYSIIRYHNVYGPGQRDHFIPEFYERALKGDLTLYGWENTRSFMYISDAIVATMRVIIEESFTNEIVNIGIDDEISIKDLAEKILTVAGIDGELVLKDAPEGSVKRRCADVSKLNRLTWFVPKIGLDEGIRLTLESLK